MPKLLSRSKHEEFESNSPLQIKDQKERRVENTKKMELAKFASCEHCSCLKLDTVHHTTTVHLLFDAVPCLFQFLFLPILSLVIAFGFSFFCNFPCSEPYISRVKVCKGNQSIKFWRRM